MSKVMIIGGGAAGMMAAIAAAYNGNDVTLFEKNEKLGKKIFITGKGRCNVTNASDIENHFKNIINKSVRFLDKKSEPRNIKILNTKVFFKKIKTG